MAALVADLTVERETRTKLEEEIKPLSLQVRVGRDWSEYGNRGRLLLIEWLEHIWESNCDFGPKPSDVPVVKREGSGTIDILGIMIIEDLYRAKVLFLMFGNIIVVSA